MAGILIVDDQDIIRQGLIKILSEMDTGFTDVYECSDGEAALVMIREVNPEIILVDIMMPKLDGLQLIEKLKKFGCKARIIIISAFNDFSYAKKAINFKVDDYILKPVSKEELFKVLISAKGQIQEENENIKRYMSQEKKYYSGLLYNYLTGEDVLVNIETVFSKLGFNFSLPYIKIVLLNSEERSGEGLEEIKNSLDATLESLHRKFYSCINEFGRLLYVLNLIQEKEDETDQAIISSVRGSQYKINCGISDVQEGIRSIRVCFGQADTALKEVIFKGIKICRYSDIKKTPLSLIKTAQFHKALDYFSRGQRNEMELLIGEIFQKITGNTLLSEKDIERNFLNLIHYLYVNLVDIYPDICDIEEVRTKLSNSKSVFGMKMVVKDVLNETFDYIQAFNKKDYSSYAINYIVNYIRKNYQKEINLSMVSNELSMNYNYISGIFTKKTGMSFSEYLTRFRLDKSKELLKEGRFRIQEIATKCGFNDPKYYCKVFKRYFNTTPGDYKNTL